MRVESVSFGTEREFGRMTRVVPYLVWHYASTKRNRLALSIRIPVTAANRSLLRELRAAEQAAWEKASVRAAADESMQEGT